MLRVADDLVEQSPARIEEIQRGMTKALDLRAAFWESMYDRAGAL
jgi:hypothetical protein